MHQYNAHKIFGRLQGVELANRVEPLLTTTPDLLPPRI